MRLYRDFDFIVQELNYLSSSIFLIFYITGSIKRKKEKWCIYYWVIISIKKFVINRAFQEFCLICQKDKGQLHKSERLKVCVVKKNRVIWYRYNLISKAYEITMINYRFQIKSVAKKNWQEEWKLCWRISDFRLNTLRCQINEYTRLFQMKE